MAQDRSKVGPTYIGGLGLALALAGGLILGLGALAALGPLLFLGYLIVGAGAILVQVAVIAAGVRLGIYHGTLDLRGQ